MKQIVLIALLSLSLTVSLQVQAEDLKMKGDQLEVTVEIPRLAVSEYHRPYVAIWIQNPEQQAVMDLAVWYQVEGPTEGFGTKWLPDLRQWWRRSGRSQQFPVDGVSSATRPVGEHTLTFDAGKFTKLAPGKYSLVVEAAREVGGRELIEVPFEWPAAQAITHQATGKKELGKITLKVKP